MLGPIRKFSTSIYAKILLGIVVIPFVFWGMGSSFTGGNKNIIVTIDKEKYSSQDFVNYIKKFASSDNKISSSQIEELLSIFIGEKLIEKEVEYYEIKLSDKSLSRLIKHQKEFKRENVFSRTEYEKFLLEMNMTAVVFETNLAKHERKKQLLNFIGGGIIPGKFLVNASYDKINQKRDLESINLNKLVDEKFVYTEEQIKSYYDTNIKDFEETFKNVEILELNPKKLTGTDEYDNLFFKKIDEIDDDVTQGSNFNSIMQKFNLDSSELFNFNKSGKDINSNKINNLSKNLIDIIFNIKSSQTTHLFESNDKYFIVEIHKTEIIKKELHDAGTKKEILFNLKKEYKRKLIAEIISKINQNSFSKIDFDKFSNDKNLPIKKISLENQNDNKIFKKDFLDLIYRAPEKKVIIVHDLYLAENFLIYIDRIKSVTINEKTNEYKKYLNISQNKISNALLNTYDDYIKKKYKLDINYKTLEAVKNYFN